MCSICAWKGLCLLGHLDSPQSKGAGGHPLYLTPGCPGHAKQMLSDMDKAPLFGLGLQELDSSGMSE